MDRINRFPPGRAIFLVNKLGHWNFGEVGITQELRAIKEGAPKGLAGQMDRFCRTIAEFRQVVALEDIEHLDQRNSA